MTTEKDVKWLVQPLLARHPELVLAKRQVVLPPVKHVMTGILLDRTAYAAGFSPCWATNFLADPINLFFLSYGSLIYGVTGVPWDINVAGIQQILADAVEKMGLPETRSIQTIAQFREFATHGMQGPGWRLNQKPRSEFYVQIALGRLDEAEETYNYLKTRPKRYMDPALDAEFDVLRGTVGPLLLARDRAGLAALLHQWEEVAVKKNGLTKYWQRTPFPLETGLPE